MVDASDLAPGVILQQQILQQWRPLPFFSQKLQPVETRYSTFGRELFPIYSGFKHFCYFLEDRCFHILTDHKALTYTFCGNHNSCFSREIRHLACISVFTTDIHFVKGLDNAAADAFSRVAAVTSSPPPLCLEDLAAAERDDSELRFL